MDLVLINGRTIAATNSYEAFVDALQAAFTPLTLLRLDVAVVFDAHSAEYRLREEVWNPLHIASVASSASLLHATRNGVALAWLRRRYGDGIPKENAFQRFEGEAA